VFKTHQIWRAFTVPPGMPDVVFMAHLEMCQILVFCTHSCSGLSTPNLVCFYNTSWHTQYGVYRVLWPEWQILECSTHPLCTLDVGVLTDCACFRHCCSGYCAHQVFTQNAVCNAFKQPMIGHARSTYSNILPVFSSVCIASEKNEVKA